MSEGRGVSGAGGSGQPALLLDAGRRVRVACTLDADLVGIYDAVAGIGDPSSGDCLLVERARTLGEGRPTGSEGSIPGRRRA